MFSLKSFSSNINSNYTVSSTPSTYCGPWKIYDAKNKSSGKVVSVFVFEKKSLEPQSGLARSGAASIKRAHDDAIERLKKDAFWLRKFRHPSILELAEPVEETRNGFMFATEAVTASLAGLLAEKDTQGQAGKIRSRARHHVDGDADDGRRPGRESELDDLELQKGLLQIAKGLEFLHESAGYVHGNLTPDAIYINAKSDWKISGLGFCGPPDHSATSPSVSPLALSEILYYDSRLPRFVQLNLDYSSPDFVLDSTVATSADLFSLGLLIVALFNSPHTSPLSTSNSISVYKRLLNSAATTPSESNDFLSSRSLPKELASTVLPRLITRRAAQRLTAREFQESRYFDNILVATIRFLESLPAKTPKEKSHFMRGLTRVLPQFPSSALEKKILPALLEEMKDRELLPLVLQNVFEIVKTLSSGRRALSEKVIPKLREAYLTGPGPSTLKGVTQERDPGKEAGLMTILQNIGVITENCLGKDFKEHILPILLLAIESPTHPLVDASLKCLPAVLPVLDYSTTKTELFPVIAGVFSKTSSLGIKIRGLEAFVVLCGGTPGSQDTPGDGLDGLGGDDRSKSTKGMGSTALDKYAIQNKMVPLIKAIKTKEPAVMMAALSVFRQVGRLADSDFVAMEVLPILWSMSLGPLLNLEQFRAFIDLIKVLSARVEKEQMRKLQELASDTNSSSVQTRTDDFVSFGSMDGQIGTNGANGSAEDDFEKLISGNKGGTGYGNGETLRGLVSSVKAQADNTAAPVFQWSTPRMTTVQVSNPLPVGRPPTSRTITPDLSSFAALTPSNATNGPSLQSQADPWQLQPPSSTDHHRPFSNSWSDTATTTTTTTISSTNNPWAPPSSSILAPPNPPSSSFSSLPHLQPMSNKGVYPSSSSSSSFFIPPPPPPSSTSSQLGKGSVVGVRGDAKFLNSASITTLPNPQQQQKAKTGLDRYESLL